MKSSILLSVLVMAVLGCQHDTGFDEDAFRRMHIAAVEAAVPQTDVERQEREEYQLLVNEWIKSGTAVAAWKSVASNFSDNSLFIVIETGSSMDVSYDITALGNKGDSLCLAWYRSVGFSESPKFRMRAIGPRATTEQLLEAHAGWGCDSLVSDLSLANSVVDGTREFFTAHCAESSRTVIVSQLTLAGVPQNASHHYHRFVAWLWPLVRDIRNDSLHPVDSASSRSSE